MSRPGATQGAEMRAAAELRSNVMGVGANIKALAAHDAEINFRQRDARDLVIENMNETWIALDGLALTGQLVERHAILFDGADHRWHLVEIARHGIECSADLFFRQRWHFARFQNLALLILSAGGGAQMRGAEIFLVLAHEQILNARGIADDENQHARGHRIERAAVPDLFHIQTTPRDGHHVVRGHAGRFVHQEDAVNRV